MDLIIEVAACEHEHLNCGLAHYRRQGNFIIFHIQCKNCIGDMHDSTGGFNTLLKDVR